jgi:hypothetical protein
LLWSIILSETETSKSTPEEYIARYGDDMPDIKGWTWAGQHGATRGSIEADNV